MVLVKRKHLASVGFDTVLKKISTQGMKKLPNGLALMKFGKKYQEDHAEMAQIYQKYVEMGDEGKAQVSAFLDEEVEISGLPMSILEDPNLELAELSAQDLYFLDAVLEK